MDKPVDAFPSGRVDIPPSKSAAHRAILCAALAKGESRLKPIDLSKDIQATLRGVGHLGTLSSPGDEDALTIVGRHNPIIGGVVDCDESGSTLRFLIPIAAALGKPMRFIGQGRLMERPMAPYQGIVKGFSQTEAGIAIDGGLFPGPYHLPGDVSSQFITGLLLALPLVGGGELLIDGRAQSAPYPDMTIATMRRFGVEAYNSGYTRFTVPGGCQYRPARVDIEADYSNAAFFLVAAALGQPVVCRGLAADSVQGDRAILDILSRCGARVTHSPERETTVVCPEALQATEVDASDIPDLVPILAVLFCFCQGRSRITHAARLRLKESDRLRAISTELSKLGARIEEQADGLVVEGGAPLTGGVVESWNDHRIAMALAVAALGCQGEVTIRGAEAVAKSYPLFWEDFGKTKEIFRQKGGRLS